MKKILLVLFLCFGLFGCERNQDGRPYYFSEICVGGVIYYESAYKLAPAFNPDSTVKTCGK